VLLMQGVPSYSPGPNTRLLHQMTILTPIVAFLFFAGSVTAQIVATDCTLPNTYNWTYNTLNQNPCKVAAYLLSTCSGGTFTVDPLLPGQTYIGPGGLDNDDMCKCNTIVYCLISACDACQGADWITWPLWSRNCTNVSPPSTFPNPVPAGIRIPQWALQDVTRLDLSLWNTTQARAIGDSPEIGPGALIGVSTISTIGTTTSTSPNPTVFPAVTTSSPSLTPTSSPSEGSSSSSNTGAIAGGVVGGITIVAVAVLGSVYLLRQRTRGSPAPVVFDGESPAPDGAKRQLSDEGPYVSSSTLEANMPPMTGYNPISQTTFPETPANPYAPNVSTQVIFGAHSGTGNTLPVQASQPQGYHG